MSIPRFLEAQARAPFDPLPTLILADWLEEGGDGAGSSAMRGLVAGGWPSPAILALSACTRIPEGPATNGGDEAIEGCGMPDGLGPAAGFGEGSGDGNAGGRGPITEGEGPEAR